MLGFTLSTQLPRPRVHWPGSRCHGEASEQRKQISIHYLLSRFILFDFTTTYFPRLVSESRLKLRVFPNHEP